jgi:hypothetical protein
MPPRPTPPRPPPQICVQGIPWKYTWQDLKTLFEPVGEVERADVMQAPDGRSKVGPAHRRGLAVMLATGACAGGHIRGTSLGGISGARGHIHSTCITQGPVGCKTLAVSPKQSARPVL